MDKEINIYNESISLFDFETFEVYIIKEIKTWFLETKEDDEFKMTIILEDDEKNYFEDHKETLEKLNFKLQDFELLKEFCNKENKNV